jgi:hypothetical protein
MPEKAFHRNFIATSGGRRIDGPARPGSRTFGPQAPVRSCRVPQMVHAASPPEPEVKMVTPDDHQFVPESESLSFPDDTVVGIINEPDDAASAVEGLLEAGIPEGSIQVMCCDSGARRLDPSGERHGILGRLQRIVQHFGDQEVAHVKRQAAELRDGRFLVAAPAEGEEEADRIANVLRSNGGHFINHYTSMTVRALEA